MCQEEKPEFKVAHACSSTEAFVTSLPDYTCELERVRHDQPQKWFYVNTFLILSMNSRVHFSTSWLAKPCRGPASPSRPKDK